MKKARFLAQGTLYPDVIESVRERARVTRSRPTTTWAGFLKKMKLKLVEPFRELFKDEVRELGRQLGRSG